MWKNSYVFCMLNEELPEKLQFLTHAIWWKEKSLINQ